MAVIRAFCPWCLALHACGVLVFTLVLIAGPRRMPFIDESGAAPAGEPTPAPMPAQDTPRRAGLVLTGLLGAGVLVAGQLMSGPARHPIRHTALPGVSVSTSDHPVLGPPDATHVVFVLADYTCPHCRTLRLQLDEAVARYGPRQLALAIVPVPLNGDCNDAVLFTEDRQRDACDLARAALAVWVADPEKFAEMDRRLLAPTEPPAAQAAREHAVGLVGAEAFDRALAGSRVEDRINGNVELYKAAGKGRLPKMLLPDRTTEGEADDAAALFALLEKHLGLAAPATGPTSP